jgi:hypothetical protein
MATVGAAMAAVALCGPGVAQAATTTCTGVLSGYVPGNVVVPNGATCILTGADVAGNVTVQPGGALRADPGTYPDALTPNFIRGNLSVTAGRLAFCGVIGGTVTLANSASDQVQILGVGANGNDQVRCIDRTRVGGSIRITGNAGIVDLVTLEVAGAVSAVNNSGEVDLDHVSVRGGTALTGNSGELNISQSEITGATNFSSNTGPASKILQLSVFRGSVTVNNNSGSAVSIVDNTFGANLGCFGNVPPPFLAGNDGGTRSGQCA